MQLLFAFRLFFLLVLEAMLFLRMIYSNLGLHALATLRWLVRSSGGGPELARCSAMSMSSKSSTRSPGNAPNMRKHMVWKSEMLGDQGLGEN